MQSLFRLSNTGAQLKRAALTVAIGLLAHGSSSLAGEGCTAPGCAGSPYADMPEIAPIGARTGKYIDIPESAKGPAIEPQAQFLADLKAAAAKALQTTKPGEKLNPLDRATPGPSSTTASIVSRCNA